MNRWSVLYLVLFWGILGALALGQVGPPAGVRPPGICPIPLHPFEASFGPMVPLDSVRALRIAIALQQPQTLAGRYCAAWLLMEEGNLAAAADSLEALTEAWPKAGKSWALRAYAAAQRDKLDIALQHYNKALAVAPQDAYLWFARGTFYGDVGHRRKAIADYTQALALDVHRHDARLNRANTYLLLNELDSARQDLHTLLSLAPQASFALQPLCYLSNELADWPTAETWCEKALRLYPEDGSCWQALGNARIHAGDTVRACYSWQKAQELGAEVPKKLRITYCR